MLFEKYVRLEPRRLIRLSQARADRAQEYPADFEALFQDILLQPDCVETPPLFEWGGVFSTCWRLERGRVHQEEVQRLLGEAQEADGKVKYALLQKAEEAAGLVARNIHEWKERLEMTRIPLLHPRFALAQLLMVRAKRFHTSWGVVSEQKDALGDEAKVKQTKMRRVSSLRAFQACELSHQLWRPLALGQEVGRLAEAAHFEIARGAEDFQETLNHAFKAQSFADFWSTTQGKNEVWRLQVQEVSLPLWSVQQFLDIYQKESS